MESTGRGPFNSYRCDPIPPNDCDPYVKLFVGEKQVLITDTQEGKQHYDVKRFYFTPNPIRKSTKIRIVMRDDDTGDDEKHLRSDENSEPMLDASETIQSFIESPIHCSDWIKGENFDSNCIEVDIIWQNQTLSNDPDINT